LIKVQLYLAFSFSGMGNAKKQRRRGAARLKMERVMREEKFKGVGSFCSEN